MRNSEIKKLSWADKLRYCRYGEGALTTEHRMVSSAMRNPEEDALCSLLTAVKADFQAGGRKTVKDFAEQLNLLVSQCHDMNRAMFMLLHYRATLILGRTPTASEVERVFTPTGESEKATYEQVRRCWEVNATRFGIEASQPFWSGEFKRFRNELELPFLDGVFLRRVRGVFNSWRRSHGDVQPTRLEFARAVREGQLRPREIRSISFNEFTDLLADPLGRDWTVRWLNTPRMLSRLSEHEQAVEVSASFSSGGEILGRLLGKFGHAVEEINLGMDSERSTHHRLLRERIFEEAEAAGMFPRLGNLVSDWSQSDQEAMRGSMGLSSREAEIWERVNDIFDFDFADLPLSGLIPEMGELEMLVDAMEPFWLNRDAISLYEACRQN